MTRVTGGHRNLDAMFLNTPISSPGEKLPGAGRDPNFKPCHPIPTLRSLALCTGLGLSKGLGAHR